MRTSTVTHDAKGRVSLLLQFRTLQICETFVHHKMDISSIKRVIHDLFSYFRIEQNERSLLFKKSHYTGDLEGSSVDPQPPQQTVSDVTSINVNPLKDIKATEGSKQYGLAGDQYVGTTASAVDIPLPKSSPCSNALSQDLFTALENGPGENIDESTDTKISPSEQETDAGELAIDWCPTLSDQSSEATSQSTEQDHSVACIDIEKEAVETVLFDEKHSNITNEASADSDNSVPAIPSTDFFGSRCTDAQEECILHRIIPKLSATRVNSSAQRPRAQRTTGKVTFNSPLFSEGDFELRIIHEKVCLEFVQIDANEIHGYVRVLNTTYVKDVTVYYTKNKWKIVRSRKAKWVETVSDGTMDRFVFTIPGRQSVGNLLFSVEFNGTLDNNKGHYYTVAYEAA